MAAASRAVGRCTRGRASSAPTAAEELDPSDLAASGVRSWGALPQPPWGARPRLHVRAALHRGGARDLDLVAVRLLLRPRRPLHAAVHSAGVGVAAVGGAGIGDACGSRAGGDTGRRACGVGGTGG
jgi:hypothetical protein